MSNIEQVKQSHYDETQIQVLEGLEAVRKRPGMYIGSTGPRGLHHLVYEIVDNAIDEALAGYCTHIETEILEGDVIRVTDNGRGIPVGIHPKMGIPAVTVVYTILHAGGKFGGEGYKVSGGLHGVGASVVNALSEWLIVEVKNGEHIYQQKFARGVAQGDLTIIGDTDETGTRVTFKPDGEIFEELVYDYETLHTRLREQAFLNAGVRMTITDRRTPTGPSDSMCYEGGIRSFVEFIHQRRGLEALHEDVIYMKGDSGDNVAEVAMQYNDSYNELLLSFANNINTGEGGTHEDGFKQALTRVLNAYARKNNLLKDSDKNLSGEDFDANKIRYNKIIIMADADVDGSHIRTLLLTFFFRHMRPLIELGHVYIAQPPLYKVSRGKQFHYAYTEAERDACIAELNPDGTGKVDIQRYKGLGEMDPVQLWETTMDPARRVMLRVNMEDAMRADETFTILMGDKVQPRREFIEQNAQYVTNLDV